VRAPLVSVLHALQCVELAQVKLWYAEPYKLRLGTVLTISTTHLSSTSATGNGTQRNTIPASIFTSIFPERDTGCKIEERLDTVCRIPIPYLGGQLLMGLMTLEAFAGNPGDEVLDAKILVCVVNVGQPQTCMSRQTLKVRSL
jgi:hypothetical protein